MYCENCGANIPGESAFCISCGAPLTQQTQQNIYETAGPSKHTVATVVLAICLTIAIVILAGILITTQTTPSVSQGTQAAAENAVQPSGQSGTSNGKKGTSGSNSTKTKTNGNTGTGAIDDTDLILIQNFIDMAYNGDWENLSPDQIAQFKPLIEKSFEAIRNEPGVAEALKEVEQIIGTVPTGATFDLIGEPEITRIGDNGVSVVVRCKMHGDDSGSMTFQDVWNLLLSEDGAITDAALSRSQASA